MSTASTLPTAATGVVYVPSALSALRHRRFTVDQYEELIRNGSLTENDRCELIRGVIIDKMGIGDLHTACVKRLNRLLSATAGTRYIVSVQDPIQLEDSEPEPDVALVTFRDDFYRRGKPRALDVLLLIEVADSSLELDRGIKRMLYAEAGIEDYWVVNLVDDCVEIYRRPQPEGRYANPEVLHRGDKVSPLRCSDIVLTMDDVLGPPVT
jgi:Uma2 family endonuclease